MATYKTIVSIQSPAPRNSDHYNRWLIESVELESDDRAEIIRKVMELSIQHPDKTISAVIVAGDTTSEYIDIVRFE